MRKMPQLVNGMKQEKMTTTFLGYNHNPIIMDGEMYDMRNMSGDQYPLLTIRKKRAWTSFATESGGVVVDDPLTGIDGRDQLTFIVGTDVYWDFVKVDNLTVSDDPQMCPKQIVNFGAYVLIFPDKKYFNTVNLEDVGTIDRLFSVASADVSLIMCRGDGTDYDMTAITVSDTAPASPTNGQLWIDESGSNDVLRQWASSTQEWVEVATTFVKIAADGIGVGLNVYDAVTISGLELPKPVDTTEEEQAAWERLNGLVKALNGSKIVYHGGENYIVVAGLINQTIDEGDLKTATIKADRKVPDLQYIVESNNRLWGCQYGMVNGQVVNEIHASALGDFRNWERYLGNSQDSYTASVGTDGPFTGAVVQKGYPVFFKEDCIHQVFGSAPSSFQVQTTVCRGIQNGSWRSAQVVNERVFYKSRTAVMMFDGSLPVSCSDQLGGILYSDARAGAIGNKYYISMKDSGNQWALFVFDTQSNTWYREDGFHALGFGRVGDELFAIDEDNNLLISMYGTVGTAEDDFDWSATFGMQGTEYAAGQNGRVRADTSQARYMSRFNIRMYLAEDTTARLEIQYNDDGIWRNKGEIRGNRMKSFVLPVIPQRCDHLQFRIKGKGDMRIYSVSRVLEVGADGGNY